MKLKVTSARLQMVVLILIVLTPCSVALSVVMGAWVELLNMPQGIPLDRSRITGMGLLTVIALGSIKPAVYMIAFWFLYKLLGLYREGIIFTAANVAAIRKIGWAIASIDIAAMLQTLVMGPVLTILQITPSHISARLEVGYLIIGLFVVLIAYVMDMGRELKEQDSLVI
ncbi:MAG: DUF2975 domain-containing protein [Candidatus Thiodiazotropha sp. (ex Dulcina madagascariensis)]|nr:DUF2975 domain-containing protein [Candidatus Thiodiazotropha sp. (ex Dulcina madagascariensis)]MCU7937199.1 DUF2975 domain-containing protein [Candidatus Thiodiazotropha sp. (ex Dulcina madagascariensis)]